MYTRTWAFIPVYGRIRRTFLPVNWVVCPCTGLYARIWACMPALPRMLPVCPQMFIVAHIWACVPIICVHMWDFVPIYGLECLHMGLNAYIWGMYAYIWGMHAHAHHEFCLQ